MSRQQCELRAQRRYAEAIPEHEAALSSNPNSVYATHALAHCKFFTGLIEEVPLEEQAIRLNPRDPIIGIFYRQIGLVHLTRSRTKEAVVWLEKARDAAPSHPNIRAQLASAVEPGLVLLHSKSPTARNGQS
jgi:adenylate cyclase